MWDDRCRHCTAIKVYCSNVKMMENNSNDELNYAYMDACECYQRIEFYLHDHSANNEEILLQLQLCLSQIENVIIVATNYEQLLMTCLINLRDATVQQIDCIQELINQNDDRKINMETIKPNNASDSIRKIAKISGDRIEQNEVLNVINNTLVTPNVAGLSALAGLEDVKTVLRTMVTLPMKQPQLFENLKTGNCILLFGPPGTGKTTIVNALAAEAKVKLHCVTASNVLSKYVGQTEKIIREIFTFIKHTEEPVIFFIDEIDGLCRHRKDDESDHTRRLKTELMCRISDLENCKNKFLICATNCPWDLDTAFIRRFQKRIYVPLPNVQERYSILKLHAQNTALENTDGYWDPVLKRTDGFSSSDMTNLIRYAFTIPIMQLQKTTLWKIVNNYYEPLQSTYGVDNVFSGNLEDLPQNSVRARSVTPFDLLEALNEVSRTVTDADVKKYEAYIKKFI